MRNQRTDLLLIIDMQNDFCPQGALAVPGGDEIIVLINRLAHSFDHVVLSQDWHPAEHASFASSHSGRKPFETMLMPYGPQILWPDHCVQGSPGAQFHKDLNIPHAEMIIRKGYRSAIDSYSVFFENDRRTPTGLHGFLNERGFKKLICVGLAFDYCVRYSAEDGRNLGYEIEVIETACRALDLDGSVEATRYSFQERQITLL